MLFSKQPYIQPTCALGAKGLLRQPKWHQVCHRYHQMSLVNFERGTPGYVLWKFQVRGHDGLDLASMFVSVTHKVLGPVRPLQVCKLHDTYWISWNCWIYSVGYTEHHWKQTNEGMRWRMSRDSGGYTIQTLRSLQLLSCLCFYNSRESKKRSLRTLKGDADNLRGVTWRNIVIVGKQCDENVR